MTEPKRVNLLPSLILFIFSIVGLCLLAYGASRDVTMTSSRSILWIGLALYMLIMMMDGLYGLSAFIVTKLGSPKQITE